MPPLLQAELQVELDATPFIAFLGIRVDDWMPDSDRLLLSMPFRTELGGGADEGHVHGGAIGALVDTATAMIVYAKGVKSAPTINYSVSLLRPVIRSSMTIDARIRKLGRTIAVVDADVFDENGKLVAVGRSTLAVRG